MNDSNFYNFYVYGARIGHESLPSPEIDRNSPIPGAWSVSEAPEVNSYLDVAVGRFSNLQTLLNDGNHTQLYRISLEGILKVPSTPLVIGFSANLGQTSVGVNTPTSAGAQPMIAVPDRSQIRCRKDHIVFY